MTAATAPVVVDIVPAGSTQRFVLETGTTAYPNAWMSLISYNHGSDATKGGQVTPFTGAAGEIPIGRNVSPSGNVVNYSTVAAVLAGATVGDGSLDIAVNIAPRIVKHVVVTGVTALTDANKPVYLEDDQTHCLAGGSSSLGVIVGFILALEDVTTATCTVYEYGLEAIYQQLIIATTIP